MKDVMTSTSKVIRSVSSHPNLSESPPTSTARVIDFVEARHRLLAESEMIGRQCDVEPQVEEIAIRRERSAELVDALEEAFYWLISAAVVVYLALEIFSL
jgi:hypothetical protein